MLRVGLTGGLSSGKTTAAHLFARLGVHLIQADEVGRSLMKPGQAVYAELIRQFGRNIVQPDGNLDRRALAALAFEGGHLQQLNRIVHPPVVAIQEEWMREVFAADAGAIAMVESALIFEADRTGSVPGWRQRFDRIVLVTAPEEAKVARYVARASTAGQANSSESHALTEAARLRLAAQIPDEEKVGLSDYVIDNSGDLAELEHAVRNVHLKLKAEAQAKTSVATPL